MLEEEGRLPYVQLAGPGRESRRRWVVESGRASARTVAFPKSPWALPFPQTLLPSKRLRTDFLAVTLAGWELRRNHFLEQNQALVE